MWKSLNVLQNHQARETGKGSMKQQNDHHNKTEATEERSELAK